MDIFIKVFGATVFLAVVFFILFLYKTIQIEREKIKFEKEERVLTDVDNITLKVVSGLTQSTVKKFKKENNWNDEVAKIVLDKAIKEIKYQVGKENIELLVKKISNVDSYLNALVESSVLKTKQ